MARSLIATHSAAAAVARRARYPFRASLGALDRFAILKIPRRVTTNDGASSRRPRLPRAAARDPLGARPSMCAVSSTPTTRFAHPRIVGLAALHTVWESLRPSSSPRDLAARAGVTIVSGLARRDRHRRAPERPGGGADEPWRCSDAASTFVYIRVRNVPPRPRHRIPGRDPVAISARYARAGRALFPARKPHARRAGARRRRGRGRGSAAVP